MKPSFSISDELLSAYIDRQVSEAETRRVEMALARDPALQEQLDALQSVVHLLQNAPAVAVPRPMTLSEGQALAAGAFVKGAEKPSGFWTRWMPRLAPLATVLVGVLLAFSLMTPMATFNAPAYQTYPAQPAEMPATDAAMQKLAVSTRVVERPAERSMPEGRSLPKPTRPPAGEMSISATGAPPSLAMEPIQATSPPPQQEAIQFELEPGTEVAVEGASSQEGAKGNVVYSAAPSPATWVLGALLVFFLYLTWRFTIVPKRRKN